MVLSNTGMSMPNRSTAHFANPLFSATYALIDSGRSKSWEWYLNSLTNFSLSSNV